MLDLLLLVLVTQQSGILITQFLCLWVGTQEMGHIAFSKRPAIQCGYCLNKTESTYKLPCTRLWLQFHKPDWSSFPDKTSLILRSSEYLIPLPIGSLQKKLFKVPNNWFSYSFEYIWTSEKSLSSKVPSASFVHSFLLYKDWSCTFYHWLRRDSCVASICKHSVRVWIQIYSA